MGKMVRETRYLWIGNLPDGVTEERLSELFGRHGRVQSVKLHHLDSDKLHAVLAFMDIKSAAKAHNSENIIDGLIVQTRYNEPTGTGLPVVHSHETPLPPARTGNAVGAEPFIWNTSSSSSSSSLSSTHPTLNNCQATPNGAPQVTRDETRHHSVSGTYSRKCHEKTSATSSLPQKLPGELSNGNMGQGEKGCIRPTPASAAAPCNCTTSDKLLMDLMSERRLHLGRYSPTHRSCVENGLKRSSASHPEDSGAPENKGICVRGFPTTLSDACIKDGLYHQYRKMGKVLSVVVTGQKEERCGIVTFVKRADVVRCLEGDSNVRSFLGYEVTISEHEGFEAKRSETRHDDYHHRATRTLFVGNLEPSVTKEQLQQVFDKYGFLIDIELKTQGQSLSYAYLQYDSIASVVRAVKDMHNKYIGKNVIKLGYGKTLPTNCLWVDGIVETVSEKILQRLFTRYGQVLSSLVDKEMHRCLVYYDSSKHAQRALTELQGKALAGKRIQIDFASKECQAIFYKNLERTGQASKMTVGDNRHTTTVTSVGPLHRPTGSQSNRDDFGGKALRDNGLGDLGPLRATNLLERLSSHSDQRHDRSQHLASDRNKGTDVETRSKAPSVVDPDVQRPTSAARDTPSSSRIPASSDCVVRSKCPGDTFIPGSGSLCLDSVKTVTDRNSSVSQSSLRNSRTSYDSPACEGGQSQGLRGKAAVHPSSNLDAEDDRLAEAQHRAGHSKTFSDPTTCDLRISSASKDVHKKQTLAEHFVKQLSQEKPENLESHQARTDRRFSTNSNSSNGGSASLKNSPASGTPGHHETLQRNSDQPAQSNCDGFQAKRNTREQPGVKSTNEKTQDSLMGLPRPHSSKLVSGKNIALGEGSVWDKNHYSKETKDVLHPFPAGSKNDTFAKTLANPQNLTVGSATESRHLTGEGKYLKNRIPDTASQIGVAAVDSPRSSRKFSDDESRNHQVEEHIMPGTSLSQSMTKQFQAGRTRTDDNIGDLTTAQPSSAETVLPESSSRIRRKSDMIDIDNLQQMKRYYQTKHKRMEDLKAAAVHIKPSASEPHLENDNPPAPSLKSSDSKLSRSVAGLPVPWHEHTESSVSVKQDPRVLSSKTGRVIFEPKLNDPSSSGLEGVVLKRGRALSLPLPRFAHWVRSSSSEHGLKRRMSDETCLLEAKTCSSGILSPHLSPNPTRSEDSCLGFKLESQSTSRISIEDCVSQDDVDFGSRSQSEDQNLTSFFAEDKHQHSLLVDTLEQSQITGTNEDNCRSPDQQISGEEGDLFAMTLSKNMAQKVEEGGDWNITALKLMDAMRTDGRASLPVSVETNDAMAKVPGQPGALEDQPESKSVDTECCPLVFSQNSCDLAYNPLLATDSTQIMKGCPPVEPSHNDEVVQSEILPEPLGGVDTSANTWQSSEVLSDALDAKKTQPASVCLFPQSDPTPATDCATDWVKESDTKPKDQKLENSTESVTSVKLEEDSIAVGGQNSKDSKLNTGAEQCGNSLVKTEPEEEKREQPMKQEDTKPIREGVGLKRKADVAFQSQDSLVTSSIVTCVTTTGSETKKERCKSDEAESSCSKHRKLDDSQIVADSKTLDSSACKQHRKESEKTHHSSSKSSSGSSSVNKHSSHSHSKTASEVRIKKEHHDKPAVSDNSRSHGKVTDHAGTSILTKRHDGIREEKDRKFLNGNDRGDVKSGSVKKSSESLSHATTKKSNHHKDGSKKQSSLPGGSNDEKKGSKTLAHSSEKSTESQYSLNSADARVSKISSVSCDKGHEKKVRCDGEQSSSTKRQAEFETSDVKARKGSEKACDSHKVSDKSVKNKDQAKKTTAKINEVNDSKQEHHIKKSGFGNVSSTGKSANGEKRSEHHFHERTKNSDMNRKAENSSHSSKKLETGSFVLSSVSKSAGCPDRKKHSSSDKNTPESRKTQENHSKEGSTLSENKIRDSDHKTKSNCLASEGKQSFELTAHKKVSETNGNSCEKSHKSRKEPSEEKEGKSLNQRLHKSHTPSSDAKTFVRTKDEKASTSKSLPETKTNNKLSISGSVMKSEKSHSRKNSISDKIRDSSSTPTERSLVTVAKHEGTTSKEGTSTEEMQKTQRHSEKCSSHTPKHRPGKSNQKISAGSRPEKDLKQPKDANHSLELSLVKKEKSTKRPEEKRELKALLQEQDEELMLAPYLSMYDMVKRRSNKEREKEQAVKMEQLRSKTLNRLQASRTRQRKKSNVSADDNYIHGAEGTNSSRFKSSSARRKSSYDEQQSKTRNWIVESSSLSSSSSSSSAEDDDDNDDNGPVKMTSRSKALHGQAQKIPNDSAKSEDNSLSSSEEEEYVPASRKRLPSGAGLKKSAQKQQKPRKSATLPVYRSSDNTDSDDDKSDAEFLTLRRNKPGVTMKGPQQTPRSQAASRAESSKTVNRKEKPRRFALFTSSSSSSSSESSDEEAKSALAMSSMSKKRNDQFDVERKHSREKAVSLKENKLRSPSNDALTPQVSKTCDEIIRKKEGKNSLQKNFKKCEPKKTVSSVANGNGTDASLDSQNNSRHVFEQIQDRDKVTKKRKKFGLQLDESEKPDFVKVVISVTDEVQQHKITKNFSQIDVIWTEESDSERRFGCAKLMAADKNRQQDVKERNDTKVRDGDGRTLNDPVPILADEIMELNFKAGADRGLEPSMRSSGQPPVLMDRGQKEPAREDVTKSCSFSRLDNIFEKMEQNDGRTDRGLAYVDESLTVVEKRADDDSEDQQLQCKEEEKVTKNEWDLKKEEEDPSVADDVKSFLSEAECDSDDASASNLGYEEDDGMPCADASDLGPAKDEKETIAESNGALLELPKQELAKEEPQKLVTTSEEEFTNLKETTDTTIKKHDTEADCTHDVPSCNETPGIFEPEEAVRELSAAVENLIEKELEMENEELQIYSKESEPSSEEQEPRSEEPNPCGEVMEEQVHLDLKYAEEKEQLGLDEDTAEEFLVEDVRFVKLDSITERRDNMVDRVITADRPVDFPYPLPSFLNMFVWVKAVQSCHEHEPQDCCSVTSDIHVEEPVNPSALEIPVEIPAKSHEQQHVDIEVHTADGELKKEPLDEMTNEIKNDLFKDITSEVKPDPLEEATKFELPAECKSTETNDEVPNASQDEEVGSRPAVEDEKVPSEKGSLDVESVSSTPPESTVSPEFDEPDVVQSKNGNRRLVTKNGGNRRTGAGGDRSGRASAVTSGIPATPKGAILRTRLQGNVQIVESFSSRGRKIIPKERDVDFMQPGSKGPGKTGAVNAAGGGIGGCGRGRGRKGKLPAGVDVRPGKKANDEGIVVEKTRDQEEIPVEMSLRPLVQRRLLAQDMGSSWKKDNAYRGKRIESLRSNDVQKISAKDTATLTIARKYGRSTARGRCLKSDTGSAKSLVIQLDKITMPSGFTSLGGKESAKRPIVGKAKKEEKMVTNGVKDLYEFEDEDEVGPIPEYTHKRPLKRVKETPPANVAKTELRTDDDEEQSGSQPPPPKRPKRMVKGRTRGRQARSTKLSQRKTRGKLTRSKPAEMNVALNESSVSSGSTGLENRASIQTKSAPVCVSDDQSSQKLTSLEPRHLPLKLEMKEQRQAAAACAAALSNRKDMVVTVTTSAAVAELPSMPTVEAAPVDEVQSNVEKVINEVAKGNFDHGNTTSSDDVPTIADLPIVQQTVLPIRIVRSASVVAENCNSPQCYQKTTSEINSLWSEAETEQSEEGSTLTSTISTHLREGSSHVVDLTDDAPPGVSRHRLPHEQVIERIPNPNTRTVPAEGDDQSARDPALMAVAAAEPGQRISPLPQDNSLRTPIANNRDVNQILVQMRGGDSADFQASVGTSTKNRSQGFLAASVPAGSGEHLRFVLAQSTQMAQQQERLLQQQQRHQHESQSISQSSLSSQSNPVGFLPPDIVSGIEPQHWSQMKLQSSIAPSRLDAKSAPSTPSQSQVHPPTAAVAPHFADTYLTPSVSGIRPDARGSHAAQSPVAGVYPQPLYSNLRLMSYLHVGVDLPSYERMLLAMTQQQQQHLISQGLILPPSIIAMPPHEALVPKRPEHIAVHCPPRSMAAATSPEHAATTTKPEPVAISRSLPEHTDVLLLLLKKYPVVWQGLLSLKNDFSAVQMHFVAGNKQLVELSLPENSQLRLSQRMRLEQSQLEQVSKRMMNPNEYCMLVALPCGQDHLDIIMQSNNLRAGFISYLQQKQAAGIVNITNPVSSQTAYVVHIFPPCQFTSGHLSDQASDLLLSINDMAYLLIVIATV